MVSAGLRCDDAHIQHILTAARRDTHEGIAEIELALKDFPNDARLHFLKGSLSIGLNRHITAHSALSRAVEIDPDFILARFQLGFFELTSGEASTALATFAPLHGLSDEHWLRHFVEGLEALIADRFEDCIHHLRAGQRANTENPPLNRDMDLIIEKCEGLTRKGALPEANREEMSATSLLLKSSRSPHRRQ